VMREDWIECKLEDMLDYIQPSKYIVDSTNYSDNYKTPVLTAGKSFIIGYTDETNNIFERTPVIIFDDFTTATQFVSFHFKVKSSAMKILCPVSPLANITYVYYFMQTIRQNTDTHKRYWISIFSKLPIKIAPLPEQRAIVAKIEQLFSELDNGIANLKAAKAKLEIYRQAVLNFVMVDDKSVFISDVVEELTQGWSPKCINQSTANPQEWAVIKTSAIQPGNFLEFENKILPQILTPREQHEIQVDDILITRAGPRVRVGVCCLVRKTRPRLINCDKVYRLRLKQQLILTEFFRLYDKFT